MPDGNSGSVESSSRRVRCFSQWRKCWQDRERHLLVHIEIFSYRLRYDDDRIMKFVLMKLTFSDGPSGESSPYPPIFSYVTEFRTTGVVMNVFLLDPSERLLSAFIWVSTSNTIGLYALPDWDKKEYVFIDTGIECVRHTSMVFHHKTYDDSNL